MMRCLAKLKHHVFNRRFMKEYKIIDAKSYEELQLLKEFVRFVANLEQASAMDREAANEIISLIENINDPSTFKEWNIGLDIFDYDKQQGKDKEPGVYLRTWNVYLENDLLEIEAEEKRTDETIYTIGHGVYFWASISLNADSPTLETNKGISFFVNDALHYEKHITESLKDIEVSIEVFEPKK